MSFVGEFGLERECVAAHLCDSMTVMLCNECFGEQVLVQQ